MQGRAPIGSVLEPVKGSVPVGKGKEDPSKLVRTPKGLEHEDPSPLYVVWEITLACDLGCRHCGSRAGDARSTEMSTEACLAAVEEMKELGVREVTLIGGEAYLREDWSQIARAITDAGMLCGITTGGQGFTQERVDEAVDAGIGSISVSIDGLERTHDAQRGKKGSFRMAREACERIARSPMRLATNTQINKLSMPELPALADLLVEMGSKAWQLQLTVPMGNAADRPDMLLQPYELLELFPLLVWIKETKITPNGIAFFPGNNIGYFGPYEEHLRYGGTKGAHWAGCGAGKWCLGVEADGKIKGCPSLSSEDYTGGYFGETPLMDVVENSHEVNHLRKRTRDDLWGFCRTCYYGDVCKAGCSWTSDVFFDRTGNNPYCIHRAIEHEKQGLRERFRRVMGAPGRPFDNGVFELFTEPIPEVADTNDPNIAGVPLSEIQALTTSDKGIWEMDRIRKALTAT